MKMVNYILRCQGVEIRIKLGVQEFRIESGGELGEQGKQRDKNDK